MGAKATFDDRVATGKARLEGERKGFDQLRSALVRFTPDFERLLGRKPTSAAQPAAHDPLQADEAADTSGG